LNRFRTACAAAALAVAVPLAAAACGGSSGAAPASSPLLRIGTTYSCNSMNPFVSYGVTCAVAYRYNYPHLVNLGPSDVGTVPAFATSWSASADSLTWTFHLHSGAKWSNGKPLTSADVLFTVGLILKYKATATAAGALWLNNVTSATAPSPTEVVIHYSKPTANGLGLLAQMPVLPKSVWAKYDTGNGAALKTFTNPAPLVSGGPYQLTAFNPTTQVETLKRNPHWYGARPSLSGFGIEHFSNPSTMVQALVSHQIDYAAPLPVTSAATVKRAGLALVDDPGLQFHDLILNQSPKETAYPELKNPLVLQAFGYATNRAQIVKQAYLGYAEPGNSIVPPADAAWHDPAIKTVPFDPAKANALLDQAGYKRGPNGVRIAHGHPMSYQVLIPVDEEGGEGVRALQIVAADFAKIGVTITPKDTDDASVGGLLIGSNNSYTGWSMSQWSWLPQVDPSFILSVITCDQLGDLSDSGYCSTHYDSLYQQQLSTAGVAARKKIVDQMQHLAFTRGPYVVTVYPDLLQAHARGWSGFVSSLGIFDYLSVPLLSVHGS
jgi:peptide/nickel transport system substrate-binding protein